MELSYVTTTITTISLLGNLFLLWDRQRLKGFDIEKQLRLNEVAKEDTKVKYKEKRLKTMDNLAERGITPASGNPMYKSGLQKVEDEEKRELDKLNINREYLLGLKSHKFPWSK